MKEEEQDEVSYKVVMNDEEQYSIWWIHRDNPLGWKDAGKVGKRAECLAFIEQIWTDMRPLSCRKNLEPVKP